MDKQQNLPTNEDREELKRHDGQQERPKTEDEQVEELAQFFEQMFKLENFRRNKYLINRANPYLEIPIRYVYEEHGVRSKTGDKNMINKALSKCSHISLLNNEYVKLKQYVIRNKLIVKGIEKNDEEEFHRFVEGLVTSKDDIKGYQYDPKFNLVNIALADEESAKKVLQSLSEKKFKEKSIDVAFNEENLYISMVQEIQAQRQRTPYYPTPFQGGYNPMFQQQQFYMNPMMNPFMGYPQNQGYGGAGRYNNYGPKPYYNKFRTQGPDQSQSQPQPQQSQQIAGQPGIPEGVDGTGVQPQQQGGPTAFNQYQKRPYVKKPYLGGAGKPRNPNYNPSFNSNYNSGSTNPNFYSNYNTQNKNGKFSGTTRGGYQKGGYPKEEVVNDDKNFPPLADS
jgi:hypothetical protein